MTGLELLQGICPPKIIKIYKIKMIRSVKYTLLHKEVLRIKYKIFLNDNFHHITPTVCASCI